METDIIVVGGGFAGSLAAVAFGRDGHDVVLIDPHTSYPVDFRCEKLEGDRLDILQRVGLADAVSRISTQMDELWIARFGRLLDKAPFLQSGFRYEDLVNSIRTEVPANVRRCISWVEAIEPSADHARVRLLDGTEIVGRLVILASGLNWSLRDRLGMKRNLVSSCHSISVGFDMERVDQTKFLFPALQYNAERVGDDVGYITLFRIGRSVRANLFVYMPLNDGRIAGFRSDPTQTLRQLMPRLHALIGEYRVVGKVKIRPTDLHTLAEYCVPGVVTIGDAFEVPCPATGRGTLKVLTDVERLLAYAPGWLATPGMGADKIEQFYADPTKRACDQATVALALKLRRMAVDGGVWSQVQHRARFASRIVRRALRASLGLPVNARATPWVTPVRRFQSDIDAERRSGVMWPEACDRRQRARGSPPI